MNIVMGQSNIPNAGRAVFSNKDFLKGDIIEFSPMLKIQGTRDEIPEDLKNIVYRHNEDEFFIGCGFTSFYSHDNPASAYYYINKENQTITIVAARKILKGEEISISYCTDGENYCEKCANTTPALFINKYGRWQTPCGIIGG